MIAMLFTTSTTMVQGETNREELLQRKPLAECAVQQLKPPAAEPPMPPNVATLMQPVAEVKPLEFYARDRDGQWSIPAEVDRRDPWIRVLILGPTAPILVDLAVHVDGVAFRDGRESWIDSLLEQAAVAPSADPVEEVEENETLEPSATVVSEKTLEETSDKDAVPVVKARSRRVPTAVARIRQYLTAGVENTDQEEIRWLIAEWAGGPGLLTLAPAVSWRRAELAPLWSLIDADYDQTLSASEIKQAPAQLRQADVDENDVIDLSELHPEESNSPYPRPMSHPLVVVLNKQTDWDDLLSEIADLYSAPGGAKLEIQQLKNRVSVGDQTLTVADIKGLLDESPDIACRIDLERDGGKIALLAVGGDQAVSSNKNVIAIDYGGTYVELTALTSATPKSENQIAVGAVVDGYPLFRLLDRDNNRRLTLRERRQLGKSLAGLDRNSDGEIAGAELPTAIRLAVTRGLLAHQTLEEPIAASIELRDQERKPTPSWFADMDRNADGDLSRREFLGTPEQFSRLDRDSDGLINVKEVQDLSSINQ